MIERLIFEGFEVEPRVWSSVLAGFLSSSAPIEQLASTRLLCRPQGRLGQQLLATRNKLWQPIVSAVMKPALR